MNKSEQLIACLEGEIAKRDEELAECRIAVENCELFRARIAELEARYQRDVYGLNNEGDPIGGEPAGGYANDNARLRAELAAIKAQGVVQWPDADEIMQMAFEEGQPADDASGYCFELEEFDLFIERLMSEVARLNAAPVSESKAQGVVMPERDAVIRKAVGMCNRIPGSTTWNAAEFAYDELAARLNAAPVQQVSVPASAFASRAITHYEAALLAAFPSGSSGEVFNQWNEARRVLAAAPAAPAGVDGCKCSMSISMLGDGCRHCQPQEYIDRLGEMLDEERSELSDAQAIIDGLRGDVGAQRVKTCIALKERNDARTERDQHAQRIGELEGMLRKYIAPGVALTLIKSTLSAGKDSEQ